MFKLNEKYDVDRKILNSDYVRYSLAETSTKNIPESQMNINIPGEDSVISLLTCWLDLNFEVIKKTDISRYANGNDLRLANLGSIALFSNFILKIISWKHLEDISHTHIVSLRYKLLISSKGSDDLSVGFDRDRGRKRDELVNDRKLKC